MPETGAVSALPPSIASGPDLVLPADAPLTVADAVARRVAESPDGKLRSWRLDGRHVSRTYAELWQRSAHVAANLAASGVKPGRNVVLLLEDQIDFAVAFLAALRSGMTIVPLVGVLRGSARSGDGSFPHLLKLFDDPAIVVDEATAQLARRVLGREPASCLMLDALERPAQFVAPSFAEPDPILLLPTSGSTGRPRLVALDPRAALYRRFANIGSDPNVRDCLGIFPVDSTSNADSVFLRHRSWTHVAPEIVAQRPQAIFEAVEEFGITTLVLPSSTAATLVAASERETFSADLRSLTQVGLGGEAVVRTFVEKLDREVVRRGGPPRSIRAGYGTTETGVLLTGIDPLEMPPGEEPVLLGSCLPGVAIRIVDERGEVVPEGEIGEVQVSTPRKIFKCYWGEEEASRNAFTADGWWRTGDLGRLRGGRLALHGRAKETLIVHGRKFSLADIDAELANVLGDDGRAFSCAVLFPGRATEQLAVAVCAPDHGQDPHNALAARLRTAVIRRFGLTVDPVRFVEPSQIPFNASGKLKRDELAALFAAPAAPSAAERVRSAGIDRKLSEIWRTALGLDAGFDPAADFFDLGGDSLRALALDELIFEAFGVSITAEDFFADPSFGALSRLVAERRKPATVTQAEGWPLTEKLHRRLLTALETWPGERPTPSRLVIGFNMSGSKPPLFWVFNNMPESQLLAGAIGKDQPLYALRSRTSLEHRTESDLQAFALRYMFEIEQLCPEGPILIGGNCQASPLAQAIAEHALRRRRHVPLLILADSAFELQPYRGRVLLIAGRDDTVHNAKRRFARAELGLHRAFPDHEFVEIGGSFAFDAHAMPEFCAVLSDRLGAALAAPAVALPADAYRVTISAQDVPAQMTSGSRITLDVGIRNDSRLHWLATERSGLTVAGRWTDADGDLIADMQPGGDLPGIAPQTTAAVKLDVVAPGEAGDYLLHVDVCDEGSRWFHRNPRDAFTVPVVVESAARNPRLLDTARRMFGRTERHSFALGAASRQALVFGWSVPENWGIWSNGPVAKLRLPGRQKHGRWRVGLTLRMFGRDGETKRLGVRIGYRGPALDWQLVTNTVLRKQIDVDFSGEDVTLRFVMPDAVSPMELTRALDLRRLGIGLIAVEMTPVRW